MQSTPAVGSDEPRNDETVLDPGDPSSGHGTEAIDSPDTTAVDNAESIEGRVTVAAQPDSVEEAIEAVRNEPEREDVDNVGRPLGEDAVE